MKKISTLVGIIIIVVAAVVLFGTVFAYQYFVKPQTPIFNNQPNTNVQNSNIQNQQQNAAVKDVADRLNQFDLCMAPDGKQRICYENYQLKTLITREGAIKVVNEDNIKRSVDVDIMVYTQDAASPLEKITDRRFLDIRANGSVIDFDSKQSAEERFNDIVNKNSAIKLDTNIAKINRAGIPEANLIFLKNNLIITFESIKEENQNRFVGIIKDILNY